MAIVRDRWGSLGVPGDDEAAWADREFDDTTNRATAFIYRNATDTNVVLSLAPTTEPAFELVLEHGVKDPVRVEVPTERAPDVVSPAFGMNWAP